MDIAPVIPCVTFMGHAVYMLIAMLKKPRNGQNLGGKYHSWWLLCPRDDSQGALCFAPVRLSGPEFSSNQFETLHKCYQPIEDVHVMFCRRINKFSISDLDNFEVRVG